MNVSADVALPPGWALHSGDGVMRYAASDACEAIRIYADDLSTLARRAREAVPKVSVIFVDVDEVLACWVDAALRLLEHDPAEVYARWDSLTPRPWDLFEVISESKNTAWRAIDRAGPSFWSELQPFPWMDDLLAACERVAPVVLLTSPSNHPSSHYGKVQWIQRHFGRTHRDYLIGACKHRCAHPNAVLIDDSPHNCDAFRQHYGQAILFPGVGNDLHHIPSDERVAYVAEQLNWYTP